MCQTNANVLCAWLNRSFLMLDKIFGAVKTIFGTTSEAGSISKYLKKNPWVGTAASYGMQRRDANRAHQRQMNDLRKAGINPILSAKLGGAQTPQMGDMGQTMNTARSIDNQETQTDANIEQIAADIAVKAEQAGLTKQQIQQVAANTRQTIAQAQTAETQLEVEQLRTKIIKENEAHFRKEVLGINPNNFKPFITDWATSVMDMADRNWKSINSNLAKLEQAILKAHSGAKPRSK